MSGILKALGVIILLSLTIRACGGKRFQEWEAKQNNKAKETGHVAEMTEDARRYVELEKEFNEARRSVMRGDSDRDARGIIRNGEKADRCQREMEAIKKKYPSSKVFKELV